MWRPVSRPVWCPMWCLVLRRFVAAVWRLRMLVIAAVHLRRQILRQIIGATLADGITSAMRPIHSSRLRRHRLHAPKHTRRHSNPERTPNRDDLRSHTRRPHPHKYKPTASFAGFGICLCTGTSHDSQLPLLCLRANAWPACPRRAKISPGLPAAGRRNHARPS
jgi:hypothetical protein